MAIAIDPRGVYVFVTPPGVELVRRGCRRRFCVCRAPLVSAAADLEQRSHGNPMDFLKPRYIPMSRRRRIYEGKAKVLYEGPEPGTLIQHFKDDATAFN